MNEIEFSKKQSEAFRLLEDDTTTELLYGGGAGGGKSFLGCLWHIHRRKAYPGSRGLIGRAVLKNLKESTLVTLFKCINLCGYKSGIDFKYNANENKIFWTNGSETILKDLFLYPSDPDFTSLGSTEFTDAFIDEGTEITEKAFEIVNSRIRWNLDEYGLVPKCLITCNPQPGWIRNRFIFKDDFEPVKLEEYQRVITALVDDNPDKSFVKLYKTQLEKMTDEYSKSRLLYGDWTAEPDVENAFATHYDPVKHESTEAKRIDGYKIYKIIDFNIDPFSAIYAHIWQDEKGYHVHVFDEETIPGGTIQKMVDETKARIGSLHNFEMTGDFQGNKKQIGLNDNASMFAQLKKGLKLRDRQVKLVTNPLHKVSRDDLNYVLYNHPDFKINPKTCPNTCRQMKITQCDATGSIIKTNRKKEAQLADHFDCIRYLVNSYVKDWIKKDKKRFMK